MTQHIDHIIEIHFHRNGICGAPFHVVTFVDTGKPASTKVGFVFAEPYHVAVMDLNRLTFGNIAFGANSWRGDVFEPELRDAIDDHRQQIEARYNMTTEDGGPS